MSQVQDDSLKQGEAGPALPPRRAAVSLWRNRDFLLLWSGQMVSSIGSQVSLVAFPWLILTLTGSPVQAGLMASIRLIPYLLFGLPAGAFIDRWDRKRVMILCDSVRALALGSIPIAFVLGHLTAGQLYLVSFTEGALFIFFGLAETACLPHVVSREQLPAATAQNEFIYSVSGLLGPSLSGMLYSLGNALPFLADAISYAASVCSLFFIKATFQEERVVATRHLRAEIVEGLSWLWHHRVMRFIALLVGGLNLSSIGYVLIVLVIAQDQHASKPLIGFIFACGGIGSIIGAFLADPLMKRFSFGPLLIWATWAWALTWLPFAFTPNPFVLGLVTAAGFVVVPIHASIHYTYRLMHIPDQLQGRVNSVYRIILFGGQALGLVLTGALIQATGPVMTVLILFVPQFLLAVATTLNPHVRKEQA
jgi:MFS family permease